MSITKESGGREAKQKHARDFSLMFLLIFLLSATFVVFYQASYAFVGFGNSTNATWYNTSWHYRIRLDINSTTVARANWTIEIRMNFTDQLPSGTLDNNSIRVVEYNSTGSVLREIASQFDHDDDYSNATNAVGDLVFIMNGTTAANTKRIFYVYYDTFENGNKPAPAYGTNLTYTWDNRTATVNNTKINVRIDTNRGENVSGIFRVDNRDTAVPVVIAASGARPAEYIEYFNGTVNTTFDLIGNATFITGPVRLTIRQEGPEVVFGNVSQRTYSGRVVKKYHIYNSAGGQSEGSFIKISQEFFINTSSINRSNSFSGALALDLRRTFLSADLTSQDNSSSDPYSWAWGSDTGGSVAGIISVNETTSNYFASNNTALGRIGISLASTNITSSVRQVSLVYFGTGGSSGVTEFLDIRNGTYIPISITQQLPEKWSVIISPSFNATIFNRNETVLIKANISDGDTYNITRYMNATLDMGTPAAGDDVNVALYDDGTNGDAVAGDRVFTNNYTSPTNATVGQWTINISAYGNATEFLNSTLFNFNITNVYSVNTTVINPNGLPSRQVVANVTVKNFNFTLFIPGSVLTCTANGVDVTNKTDNNDGTYSINFTAPSALGNYTLFCNATKAGNLGNDTETFITEATTTTIVLTSTPSSVSVSSVALFSNESFSLTANATNNGSAIARNANITLELFTGWSANTTLQNCGDIGINVSCIRQLNITVPNNTAPGVYTINLTTVWTNTDNTQGQTRTPVNVTVASNPQVNISEVNLSGTGADGTSKTVSSFTILSLGNTNATNIVFNCTAGPGCSNFNVAFLPVNISSLSQGSSQSVSVIADIPLNHTPGTYNATINASSGSTSDTVLVFITLQGTTNLSLSVSPVNTTISNITIFSSTSFQVFTNATNIGNSSARNATINFTLLSGWSANSSLELCGNITKDGSCVRNTTVTVPNNTLSGNYTVNITVRWVNLDGTLGSAFQAINVNVVTNPVLDVSNATLTGTATDGTTANAFNLTILSIGSSNITNVNFTCTSGIVCNNFTPSFSPSTISTLGVGLNTSVNISVTVPSGFQAGTYNGTLNASAANDGSSIVTMFVTVPINRRWNMTPVFCQKVEFPDEGAVCDVNVSNTGNDQINFTIISVVANKTSTNVTNFSVPYGGNYIFSVLYNVTGFPQLTYNSTYVVSSLLAATPGNITLNVTLLPYIPPTIVVEVSPNLTDQTAEINIIANITDNTNTGISFVNLTVKRPDGTADNTTMTLLSQSGNFSRWRTVYANVTNTTYGNTTQRGRYNVTVFASDTIGNLGNSTSNFTIRVRLNIAANTLASQYYQGDTATIFYSARNITNAGVQNVNVSFTVTDPNSTVLYSITRLTDALGTFSPLPVFSLASDAIVGSYNLTANSTYNDTVINMLFTVQNNYTFGVDAKTVTVSGLFADVETAVVWFPNQVMRFHTLVYDGEGKPVDPSNLTLTVYDPALNVYFTVNLSSMTKQGTGFYYYSFAMPASTANGMYLAVINVTRSTMNTMKLKAFRVAQGGPYDVRLTVLKSDVEQGNPLDFTITIENKGEVTQDVFVDYTVTSVATGTVYYTASEAMLTPAFSNQTFTRGASIFSTQPLGTYTLKAVVRYDNTQPAINASTTFNVIAKKSTTQPSGGGGGGGGAGGTVTTLVTNTQTPEILASIFIEKYNSDVVLYPGFKRIEYVVVRNTGKIGLSNIVVNIVGLPTEWFNITPESYKQLGPDNSSVFLVEYNVPEDAQLGDYRATIIAASVSASEQKTVNIRIVKSISDLILEEIRKLKEEMKNLLIEIGIAKNQGKNIKDVILITDQADEKIKSAERNLDLNNTQTAFHDITDARVLIEKAKDLLSRLEAPEEKSIDLFLLLLLLALIGGTSGGLYVMKKKNALPKHAPLTIAHFSSIIEKIRGGKRDDTALMKEKEKISRMLSVLENEKREGIVSEEAYREMRKTVESRLEKIEKKVLKKQ